MKKSFFKKIAKVVMTIGVAGMLINVGACGVNESAGEGIEPVYEDNDSLVLPVTAFWAPPPTEEYFSDLKDCGFTHVYIENKFGKPGSSGFLQAINLCEKLGIKAIPQTQWVDGVKQSYKDDPTEFIPVICFARSARNGIIRGVCEKIRRRGLVAYKNQQDDFGGFLSAYVVVGKEIYSFAIPDEP